MRPLEQCLASTVKLTSVGYFSYRSGTVIFVGGSLGTPSPELLVQRQTLIRAASAMFPERGKSKAYTHELTVCIGSTAPFLANPCRHQLFPKCIVSVNEAQ